VPLEARVRIAVKGRVRRTISPPHVSSAALRFLLLLAALLAVPASGVAQPRADGVERHVETVYYVVEGETMEQLAQSLRSRGPVMNGEQFFGRTEWTVNAEYQWVERDTGCRIENPIVRVAITITMPRWDPKRGTPPELLQAWSRFIDALAEHEDGHRHLADEAARAVSWELATLRYPHCTNAEARTRKRVAEIMEDYNQRNRDYDARTRHGLHQGAAWPPPRRVGAPPAHR